MPTPEQVMRAYVALWNATDEQARRRLAETVLTEDAAVIYPTIAASGRDGVVAALGRFHEQVPGASFEETSGVEQHHGWLRASWRLVQTGGKVRLEGEDVAELAEDGRLRRVLGFHNPLPSCPSSD
ncbi:MAG TPA: nuclear transport factor 2 family protein [Chloroflexota bacterium]|nr:nuclear transport factor 2 family protein [Chloroflexota bacterium]